MSIKMLSEDANFIAQTNNDVFAIEIRRYSDADTQSPARVQL